MRTAPVTDRLHVRMGADEALIPGSNPGGASAIASSRHGRMPSRHDANENAQAVDRTGLLRSRGDMSSDLSGSSVAGREGQSGPR